MATGIESLRRSYLPPLHFAANGRTLAHVELVPCFLAHLDQAEERIKGVGNVKKEAGHIVATRKTARSPLVGIRQTTNAREDVAGFESHALGEGGSPRHHFEVVVGQVGRGALLEEAENLLHGSHGEKLLVCGLIFRAPLLTGAAEPCGGENTGHKEPASLAAAPHGPPLNRRHHAYRREKTASVRGLVGLVISGFSRPALLFQGVCMMQSFSMFRQAI